MTASETILDLKGLNCPLPALRTAKALRKMPPGSTLVVECTDPMAAIDVPHSALQNGGTLESRDADGGVLTFRIRRDA